MNFREYVHKANVTNDPRGDFIRDARRDENMPAISSWAEMRAYLERANVSTAVLTAAGQAWQSYRAFVVRERRRPRPRAKSPHLLR